MRPALLIALAALAALVSACGSSEGGTAARPSSDFVESVGVNVHMSYTDTSYSDAPRVRRALNGLGVRHVRDGLVADSPPQHEALRALGEEGIRSTLIIGDPDGRFGSGTIDEQLATLKEELGESVDAIESPNEYDATGEDFAGKLSDYQRRLASAVEEDPELRERPLIGPSFINASSFGELGRVEGIDFGNIHSYSGGEPPESNVAENISLAGEVSGRLPVYATETGYHNALGAVGEGVQPAVPERAAAIYLPRLYLDYFRRGVARTFAYELLDQRPDPRATNAEVNFGLLRDDFSPKPAYRAMRNLMNLVDDSEGEGGAGGGGRLEYSLLNDDGVRSVLLEKPDGRFYLALWRADTSVWNTEGGQRVDPGERSVEVRLGTEMRRAAAHRPSVSSEPQYVRQNTSALRADLGADVLVLELTPAE